MAILKNVIFDPKKLFDVLLPQNITILEMSIADSNNCLSRPSLLPQY